MRFYSKYVVACYLKAKLLLFFLSYNKQCKMDD